MIKGQKSHNRAVEQHQQYANRHR